MATDSVIIYEEQENGNLKALAEVEDMGSPALAVDALLDEMPRLKTRDFVCIIGSLDEGNVTRVTVEDDEPIQPKRRMTISANGSGSKAAAKRARAVVDVEEDDEEEEAPKPRRKTTRKRSTAAKGTTRKRSTNGRKTAATRKKAGTTRRKNPLSRTAAGDE